ncbi:hypothetical protein B0H13DRAFT_1995065 [Mycena leptocephala]|nr:hypothetical protein B0H13DRAFT_1995065 [Mycena leptocephala]
MSSSGNISYPTSPPYDRSSLTTPKTSDRPSSRSSVRSNRSSRAPSPSVSPDDPGVSTLKHTIRHQQAQLQSLENMLLRGPRPYPSEISDPMALPSTSPPNGAGPGSPVKTKRRSSYDVVLGIAGADSNLPLPRRDPAALEDFREGIPMTFNGGPTSPPKYNRGGSPTRTLSRIPVSSVGNARALADEGQPATHRATSTASTSKLSIDTDAKSPSSLQPPSPNHRMSLTPGNTTKVLADLQTGVSNARNALENTKAQLRVSQRSVAQLTRQTEDLKEGRERLRLENEGLNNVVARKERLLQEVRPRARAQGGGGGATLKTQLKSETSTSKKTIREMELALTESTALSQKSEREYITLRDSIKGLVEGFKSDTDRLREEMTKREEKWRSEAESVGKKYRLLLEEIKGAGEGRAEIKRAREADQAASRELEKGWQEEIQHLKEEVDRSNKESEEAGNTARGVAELARLRRLMQNVRRLPSFEDGDAPT